MVKTHGSSSLDPGSLLFAETESLGSRLGLSLQKKFECFIRNKTHIRNKTQTAVINMVIKRMLNNVQFRTFNFTLYNIFHKLHALSDLATAKHELHWNICENDSYAARSRFFRYTDE